MFIQTLIKDGKVGHPFPTTEKLSIYIEGQQRYQLPDSTWLYGYNLRSKRSTKTQKFGDLIIWKELLKKASEEDRPFIFITDNEKEDWWEISEDKNKKKVDILGARKELLSEFNERARCKNDGFLMLRLSQFNNHISIINRVNNIGAKLSYIELNAEEITLDIIECLHWQEVLDRDLQLTKYLTHSEYLEDTIDQNVCHIEIAEVSPPQFDDLYVDFNDETVTIDGTFTCDVEAKVETSLSKCYSAKDSAIITISGSISLEFTFDYDRKENFINGVASIISISDFIIEKCKFEKKYDYESIACIDCKRRVEAVSQTKEILFVIIV